MQYKIPQNVRIEDKIVGPLTLKQLISLGIGGGITYALYIGLAKDYIFLAWFIPVMISGGTTLLFTFVKIRELSFGKWVLLTLEFLKNPKKRIFMMGGADLHPDLFISLDTPKNTAAAKDEGPSKFDRDRERLKHIAEISKSLDNYSKPSTP